jgi:tyrosyl-tRNA synthetase
MLSRELLPKIGWQKPVCIFTPLITSLKGPGTKMSASIPGTHIKIHESEEKLKKLISDAYCPPKEIDQNPIVEIAKYIIFPTHHRLRVEREIKFGGDIEYNDFNQMKSDYQSGNLHPTDLKNAVYNYLRILTQKVRRYFENKQNLIEDIKKTYHWSEF